LLSPVVSRNWTATDRWERRAARLGIVFALALFACDHRSDPGIAPPLASAASAPIPDAAPPPSPISSGPTSSASVDAAIPSANASDAGRPLTAQQRATHCLDDPICPAVEADRLFRAAEDAREGGIDCFRFSDGDGTKKDLGRARACLERDATSMKCDGSSAGLAQAELAIYRIDGVGGPQDIRAARELFDGCFADVTQQHVLEYAAAREANPAAPRVDFCKDYGGTTLTSDECSARARQREATRMALQAKGAASALDDDGKRLLAAASTAFASYAKAMGSYVYQLFKEGSIRNAEALTEETAILSRRTAALAKFATFAPAAIPPQDLERSSRSVDEARRKRTAGSRTPDIRAKIEDAESTWTAYRDAEIALYVHAFGARSTPDAVRSAVLIRLNRERVVDLGR
jgi:hypothetical protein